MVKTIDYVIERFPKIIIIFRIMMQFQLVILVGQQLHPRLSPDLMSFWIHSR